MKAKISSWVVFAYIVLTVGVGFFGAFGGLSVRLRWIVIVGLMLGFLMLLGYKMYNRWDGVLIDNCFKMRLARFQILLWTLMTFSAFFAIALERDWLTANPPQGKGGPAVQYQLRPVLYRHEQKVKKLEGELNASLYDVAQKEEALLQNLKDIGLQTQLEDARTKLKEKQAEFNDASKALERFNAENNAAFFDALNIVFPYELLLALGISTASLAGATIIKNVKKGRETSRSLELATAEKERFQKKQLDAQNRQTDAVQKINDLMRQENTLKDGMNEQEREIKALEGVVNEKKKEVAQVEEDLSRQSGDAVLQAKLEKAKTSLQEKLDNFSRASKAFEDSKKILAVQIEENKKNIALKTESESANKIAFDRATEELKRIADADNKREGSIHKNEKPEDANWADMFRGDEVSNYKTVDVSKVQMFFFTIAIVFTYGVMIWLSLTPEALSAASYEFPAFSGSMNALLGLSHAGYLVVKSQG